MEWSLRQHSDIPKALRDRKRSHLDLCRGADVEHRHKSTLFEDVELIHNSVPELSVDELDLTVDFVGKRLRAPLLITGMTGGTEEGFSVNHDLATVAERTGIAFGVGSQRLMQRDPGTAWTFAVRDVAPSVVLLANIGIVQAAQQPIDMLRRLVADIGADALCVHLNPAQEMVQPEGDRDFRGGLDGLARLCSELAVPVIAKETGCGISRATALALRSAGIRLVDISGAGGTSWVEVEAQRGDERSRELGSLLSSWGIPTAASLAMLSDLGLELIASGGVRSGLEMAKAIALGACVCGVALPVYRAYCAGGIEAAVAFVDRLVDGLKTVMLLTGSKSLAALSQQPIVIGPAVQRWLHASPMVRFDGRTPAAHHISTTQTRRKQPKR